MDAINSTTYYKLSLHLVRYVKENSILSIDRTMPVEAFTQTSYSIIIDSQDYFHDNLKFGGTYNDGLRTPNLLRSNSKVQSLKHSARKIRR